MTTFTRTWNAAYEASPADSQSASQGATRIREVKADVQERLEVDHSHLGDTDDGAHVKITFVDPLAAKPTQANDETYLYTKDVSATSELFFEDEAGNEIQLTSAGSGILGGLTSSQFLRSDAADTTTGDLTISKAGPTLSLDSSSGNTLLLFRDITTTRCLTFWDRAADSYKLRQYDTNGTTVRAELILTELGKINIGTGTFQLAGVDVTATAAELNYNDISTLGTGQASKCLTLNSSRDVTNINSLSTTGSIIQTGTTAVHELRSTTSDSVVQFEDSTTNRAQVKWNRTSDSLLLEQYDTDGTTIRSRIALTELGKINIETGTFQISGVDMTSSAAELNYNDITTLGTAQASKVVTTDANKDIREVRKLDVIDIVDTNDNEVISIATTASAINEITVTNAATGNAPDIAATGDDTNINLELSAKGTGTVNVDGRDTRLGLVQQVTATDATRTTHVGGSNFDDTIPTTTEGAEILTVAITPIYSTSSIELSFEITTSMNIADDHVIVTLIDKTGNTTEGVFTNTPAGTTFLETIVGKIIIPSPGTSANTYSIRVGAQIRTVYVNGNTTRKFGGLMETRLTATEIL